MKKLFGLLMILSLISGCDNEENNPSLQLQEKGGILEFNSGINFDDKIILVHYFIPKGDVSKMQFQIIMHGADRNAKDYLAGWAKKARTYNLIIVAPEFSVTNFKNVEYNEGNFITSGTINLPEKTTFSLIDQIFEFMLKEFELKNEQYNIYGHSAGAQFVHRYVQFYDTPKLNKAIAANAGWYTFPDENIAYPYGIARLFNDNVALRANFYNKPLIILLGTNDIIRDSFLRTTKEADNQGSNRLERGNSFFELNENKAKSANQNFNWQREYVENVGHNHIQMSEAAADLLYQ